MNAARKLAVVLIGLLSLVAAAQSATTQPATQPTTDAAAFPGDVRLVLPKFIYASPGVESNVYFDNIVLVINPANYVFDVTCPKGFQYDDRWTFTPADTDAGDHPITIEVRDQSNAVIARASSIVRVAPTAAGQGKGAVSLLVFGDSHLQKDAYLDDVLELSKKDADLELKLIGTRGRGNKPPSDELRHEGYNGWTAGAFLTMSGSLSRSGEFKRPETGSPFVYTDADGKSSLDFGRYCKEFNDGKPIDYVVIQVGGNDIWRATDADIDATIDTVFANYDALIRMIHDHDPKIKVGLVVVDSPARSQHGFRNYRAERKQTRWQYRRNQHRMFERQVETYGQREADNVFLLPVNLNIDAIRAYPMRSLPRNARMPAKEDRVNDGSHMSPEGYQQFGDPIYAWLKVAQ